MNIEKITQNLNTKFLGKNIKYYKEIDSTQDEIKRLEKKEKVEDGTLLIAGVQTNGRGQYDRSWFAEANQNILMTFVFYPKENINTFSNITIDIAKSIEQVLSNKFGVLDIKIKHPNDLMLGGKKFGGILTEAKTEKENVNTIYVGIGINVNSIVFDENIKNIATSLKKEYKKDFDIEKIISEILNDIEKKYIKLLKL